MRNGRIIAGSKPRCSKPKAGCGVALFLLDGMEEALDGLSEIELPGGIKITVLALENLAGVGDRNGFHARPAQIYPDRVIHPQYCPSHTLQPPSIARTC